MQNDTTFHALNQDPVLHNLSNLTKSDIAMYRVLEHVGQATTAQIADVTGLCPRQVSRSGKALAALNLITINRLGRVNVYSLPGSKGNESVRDSLSSSSSSFFSTDSETQDKRVQHTQSLQDPAQLALIENGHAQNLGLLDIAPQAMTDLRELSISPNALQRFASAPELAKHYSPAKILMHFDADGTIAANLAAWADAWRDDSLDLDYHGKPMSAALIWVRILEGQVPPMKEPAIAPIPQASALDGAKIDAIPIDAAQPPLAVNFSATEGDGESELDAIWRDALERLRGQMLAATYDKFLKGSRLVSLADGVATVQPPDALAGERLAGPMRGAIERVVGATVALA